MCLPGRLALEAFAPTGVIVSYGRSRASSTTAESYRSGGGDRGAAIHRDQVRPGELQPKWGALQLARSPRVKTLGRLTIAAQGGPSDIDDCAPLPVAILAKQAVGTLPDPRRAAAAKAEEQSRGPLRHLTRIRALERSDLRI
jgi:hypothetical protein